MYLSCCYADIHKWRWEVGGGSKTKEVEGRGKIESFLSTFFLLFFPFRFNLAYFQLLTYYLPPGHHPRTNVLTIPGSQRAAQCCTALHYTLHTTHCCTTESPQICSCTAPHPRRSASGRWGRGGRSCAPLVQQRCRTPLLFGIRPSCPAW